LYGIVGADGLFLEVGVDHLVHVRPVRLSRGQAEDDFPAIHGEKGFEDRKDKEQQREPRRDLRVARDQQHGQFRHPEAEQVSPAVAEEDLSLRVVPDQESEQRTGHGERRGEKKAVSDLG